MTTTYGMTDAGFVVKPFDVIKSEREAAYRARLAASLDTSAESVAGILIAIESEREAELWELALATWNSRNPDFATGVSLVELAGISGTLQDPPKRSTVTATWTGTPGTLITAGRIVSVAGNSTSRFQTIDDATVAGGGTIDVPMESVDYGAYVANSGTLTVIETPVGGITGVTNALDAELGQLEETDASLRLRRELELRAQGQAAADAIRAVVSQVVDVTSVTVFHNDFDATDVDGIPPHAVEALVQGGDDDAIRAAIWAVMAGGIYTHGSEVGTTPDAEGVLQTVRFTRPTEDDIQVELTFSYVAADYPPDGDDQVKQAVVDAGRAHNAAGRDVVLSQLQSTVWAVSGVFDVTAVRASIVPAAFSGSNVVVAARAQAAFDTGRVTLIKTPVVPS